MRRVLRTRSVNWNDTELNDDIWWVGAIDWDSRDFHGYETARGTSYNAYLILDEKVALVDGCREGFGPQVLSACRAAAGGARSTT